MTRHTLSALTALALLAACGPKKTDGGEADPNAAPGTTTETVPVVPRVTQVQIGQAADSTGWITAVNSRFKPTDTVTVSVTTENAGMGTKVDANLMQGTNHLAMATGMTAAPDSTQKSRVVLKLVSAKPLAVGKYQIDILFNGVSQGLQEIEIYKD